MHRPKILFICKQNETYGFKQLYNRKNSGLFNSTKFVSDALKAHHIHSEVIQVTDNNDIDREVTKFRPNIVVLEALWVVPEKFDELMRLHPKVKWFVHLHSNIPFLAMEGIAVDWIIRSARKGVGVIANSHEAYHALEVVIPGMITYLPNVYLGDFHSKKHASDCGPINIGCFGAVRPLKNQLTQAIAAIKFAEDLGRPLRFHINSSRVETDGDPVLKNIRLLFKDTDHELVEVPWLDQGEFLEYLEKNVDMGLQASLSETFNNVAANYVAAGLPMVISREVKWASSWCQADPDSVTSMVNVMHRVWRFRTLIWWNQKLLNWTSQDAEEEWVRFVRFVTRNPFYF